MLCEKPLALTLRRRPRDGRGLPKARRRDGHQPSSAQCRHAPGHARGDRGRRASAGRCSRACSTPSTCRRTCRAGGIDKAGGRRRRGLDITVHDADTLRFVLGDDPVEVDGADARRPAWRRRAWRTASWRRSASAPACWRRSTKRFTTKLRRHRLRGAWHRRLADRARRDDPAADRHGAAAHCRGRRASCRSTATTSTRGRSRAVPRRDRAARASPRPPARTASGRLAAADRRARNAAETGADRSRARVRLSAMRMSKVVSAAEAAAPDPRRRRRIGSLVERPRLPGRGAGGDRRALRRRRPPARPDDAAPDRRRRHVRHQGHRPYRQAGPARKRSLAAPIRRGPSSLPSRRRSGR